MGNSNQASPTISLSYRGNFILAWEDKRNGDFDIYAQLFSKDCIAIGINFKVNDDVVSATQEHPSVSTDNSGNFVISWMDERNGFHTDIYAQCYDSNGTAIGNNFKVNSNPWNSYEGYPSTSKDNTGNFVITWITFFNGDRDIYAQRYSSNGQLIGDNFRITNTSSQDQQGPNVILHNDRIYNTWKDNRTGEIVGDIWANVLDWNNPIGAIEEELLQIPPTFVLHQNYPNPFNPSTTIEFNLPKTSELNLKVFNILGEEVATLVSGRISAGSYSYEWDASQLASGLYLYRLEAAGFVETKKMVLMK